MSCCLEESSFTPSKHRCAEHRPTGNEHSPPSPSHPASARPRSSCMLIRADSEQKEANGSLGHISGWQVMEIQGYRER